jgi:AbiV family abortive infection protein
MTWEYGDAAYSEEVVEVASNARRLLADAELLFEHGRHPTAASLAILAMEEVGKVFQILSASQTIKKLFDFLRNKGHVSKHVMKQNFVTSMSMAEVILHAWQELLSQRGLLGDPETMRAGIQTLRKEEPEKWIKFYVKDKNFQKNRQASSGELDLFKQKGFYVDIKDRKILSTPNDMTLNEAEQWIEYARQAVDMLPPCRSQ